MSNHEAEALAVIEDVLPKAVDVRDAAQMLVDIFADTTTSDGSGVVQWGRASTTLSAAQSAVDQLDHMHIALSSGR